MSERLSVLDQRVISPPRTERAASPPITVFEPNPQTVEIGDRPQWYSREQQRILKEEGRIILPIWGLALNEQASEGNRLHHSSFLNFETQTPSDQEPFAKTPTHVAFAPLNLFIEGSLGATPDRMEKLVEKHKMELEDRFPWATATLASPAIWTEVMHAYHKREGENLFGRSSTITSAKLPYKSENRVVVGDDDPRLGPHIDLRYMPMGSNDVGAALLLVPAVN